MAARGRDEVECALGGVLTGRVGAVSSLSALARGRGHHGASGKGLVWSVLSQALFYIPGALPKGHESSVSGYQIPGSASPGGPSRTAQGLDWAGGQAAGLV